ncbi:MAG: TIGR03546 family protein [Desulfobacterales bacterium]|nr:TIGR03546 family protein [Desulfobacterales bacterium]
MLRTIADLLRILNSGTEPGRISLAFCFAMVAGLTPLFSLHNLVVLLLVLLLRVNLSTFILGLGFFSGIAYLLDPLFHRVGLAVLTAGALEGLWTALYNMALLRLEKFNNSIVMGSLFFSLLIFAPLYLIANQMILRYRQHVLAWVQKSRIMQAFKASRLYRLYSTYSEFEGAK